MARGRPKPGDSFEAHPYVFPSEGHVFRLADFADTPGMPGVPGGVPGQNVRRNVGRNPVIINEYCSGFLDRDGNPTIPRMAQYYEENLGPHATTARRLEFRAGPSPPRLSSGGRIGKWPASCTSAAWPTASRWP